MATYELADIEDDGSAGLEVAEGISWIGFEAAVAHRLLDELHIEIQHLRKKHTSAKRVHDTRVALRRWGAVWHVMRADGWESSKFLEAAIEPLNELLKHLGDVRDFDVMIELASHLQCTEGFMHNLEHARSHSQKELKKALKDLEWKDLVRYMRLYLEKRKYKLEKTLYVVETHGEVDLEQEGVLFESVEARLNEALFEQEKMVRRLEDHADTPHGLHQLRLSLKSWRYVLSELCGIKNQELEDAQTLLGEIHDLDTLQEILIDDGKNAEALKNLEIRRRELLDKVPMAKENLPFGMRTIISPSD